MSCPNAPCSLASTLTFHRLPLAAWRGARAASALRMTSRHNNCKFNAMEVGMMMSTRNTGRAHIIVPDHIIVPIGRMGPGGPYTVQGAP